MREYLVTGIEEDVRQFYDYGIDVSVGNTVGYFLSKLQQSLSQWPTQRARSTIEELL
jgi:hypothetical protein